MKKKKTFSTSPFFVFGGWVVCELNQFLESVRNYVQFITKVTNTENWNGVANWNFSWGCSLTFRTNSITKVMNLLPLRILAIASIMTNYHFHLRKTTEKSVSGQNTLPQLSHPFPHEQDTIICENQSWQAPGVIAIIIQVLAALIFW